MQQSVALLERDPRVVGQRYIAHEWAIKCYTRSAAARDSPLPQQVRSGPVLHTTMHFICCYLLDRDDVSWAEIHDFVFDRTRCIRQDLMYQRLSDDQAIAITERCVRFHLLSLFYSYADESRADAQNADHKELKKCFLARCACPRAQPVLRQHWLPLTRRPAVSVAILR